jgi:hypothetical protein
MLKIPYTGQESVGLYPLGAGGGMAVNQWAALHQRILQINKKFHQFHHGLQGQFKNQ